MFAAVERATVPFYTRPLPKSTCSGDGRRPPIDTPWGLLYANCVPWEAPLKMPKIRPATERDIPRILDLYHELTVTLPGDKDCGRPALEACAQVLADIAADPRHDLLVVEDGGEVAGTAVLLIVPNLSHGATPWALVENIIVDQRFRRRGLARKLLEHTVSRAREAGCHRIEIMSDNSRKEAHRLYRSVGFTDCATGFRNYFDH